MRQVAEAGRIRRFMAALGEAALDDARVYLTGGASAVLQGWRSTTLDVDIEIVPDRDELLRALPELKERLEINVELAAPSHFIPELPGWVERSVFIVREGREKGQGIGYLSDGTMVVVNQSQRLVGQNAEVQVLSLLQTGTGTIVFADLKAA